MYFYTVLTPISTTSILWSTGKTRKYQQIDVYIYQCGYWSGSLKITKLPNHHSMLGHHRNACKTPFKWRADHSPLLVLFGSSLPSSKKERKKNVVRDRPPLAKLSGSAHGASFFRNTWPPVPICKVDDWKTNRKKRKNFGFGRHWRNFLKSQHSELQKCTYSVSNISDIFLLPWTTQNHLRQPLPLWLHSYPLDTRKKHSKKAWFFTLKPRFQRV